MRCCLVLLSLAGSLMFSACDDDMPKSAPAQAIEPAIKQTPVPAAQPASSDPLWPRWSGPAGDMISRETGWNSNWNQTPPKVVWQAEIGTGFSSVSVDRDHLYTMGNVGGKDFVYCLLVVNGEFAWKHSYECGLVDNLHEGGPSATPTIDEDRVFTVSKEGHLFCCDALKGDVLWSGHLQKITGTDHPEWGFTCSPLVLDEKLIIEAGRVVAINKKTGKTIWKSKTGYRPGYGSPVVFDHHGQQLIAVLNNDGVLVVRLADGGEVAFYEWETSFATNSTTPIVVDNTIYISTGYHRGCTLLRLDGNTLESIYENRKMRNHFNNSVLWKGYLYGVDGNSHNPRVCQIVCMNFETGEQLWGHRGFGCGSVMIADEKLLILSGSGELVLAELNPAEFKEIGRVRVLDGRCWTVPVLANGRIYCRNAAGNLVCVDVSQ